MRVFEYCVTAAPDVIEQVAIALWWCSPVFPLRTSQALLHGVRGLWLVRVVWCVVCGVWCVVCGVWCVVCGVWCVVCWLAWVPSGGGSQGDDSGHPEAAVSVLHHPGGV